MENNNKATLPTFNRMVRVLPQEDKTKQAWHPLVAIGTPQGSGVLVAEGVRCAVPSVIAHVLDAFMASGAKATFASIGHGIRFVVDGSTGQGSPCFLERSKVASRTLYLYGQGGDNRSKLDPLLATLAAKGVTVEASALEKKGGAYITLPVDLTPEQAETLVRVLGTIASVKAPNGYNVSMGDPADLEGVSMDSMPAPAPEAPKVEGDKPKGKRGRPRKVEHVEAKQEG